MGSMLRNRTLSLPDGTELTFRIERKYVPGFLGESLLYLFRPEDGSPRFTYMVSFHSSLVPRLGPEFDKLGEAGIGLIREHLDAGIRRDLRIEVRLGADPVVTEMQGLRKFPMPGADGGEVGSWG